MICGTQQLPCVGKNALLCYDVSLLCYHDTSLKYMYKATSLWVMKPLENIMKFCHRTVILNVNLIFILS